MRFGQRKDQGLVSGFSFRALVYGLLWGSLAGTLIILILTFLFPWYTNPHPVLPGGWTKHP